MRDDKLNQFWSIRTSFDVNPALAFACGDEYRDYAAAVGAGLHPFIVSYGFEDWRRLRADAVPEEVIATTPQALAERLRHALDLPMPAAASDDAVGR